MGSCTALRHQSRCDLRQRQLRGHRAHLERRGRHTVDDAAVGILADRHRALVAHRLQPLRAVGAHTGQDRADGGCTGPAGDRMEQPIDRGAVAAHLLVLDQAAAAQRPAGDLGMIGAAGCDIDMPHLQRRAGARDADVRRRQAVEPRGEGRHVAFGHMLDDDRGRTIDREAAEQLDQRLDATGRRSDRDHRILARHVIGGGCALDRCRLEAGADAALRRRLDQPRQIVAQAAAERLLGLFVAIERPQFERADRRFRALAGQRRQHDDGHGAQAHDLFEEVEAVHPRHLDIERDDVGVERLDHLARGHRPVGGADDLDIRILRQAVRHHRPHRRRIIDH
ncbi:hypothetical protein WR25_01976 [Diploscapter pachys]|uniref:Uncharacterized protein n=1 Tax=Diploscapter pachys TaxID=2018661 RepID=A0A2A2K9G5_9BILA|nr:hypothetical protein WR25_01976 [Diploscapter pachys]